MVVKFKFLFVALLMALALDFVVGGPGMIGSARAGEAEDAQVERGVAFYDDGDYAQAKAILLPLAEAGHPKAMNMIGLMYSKGYGYQRNRALACDWYERSAEAAYVSAMSNLSTCYYWGNGRLKDIAASIDWKEQAANLGHKGAQADLAAIYVDLDREKYLHWAQKAAANGSVKAKALMWGNGDRDLVPDLRWTDLVCVVVMIGWFNKSTDYCD